MKFISPYIAVIVLAVCCLFPHVLEAQYLGRYSYDGTIQLDYNRQWADGSDASNTFTHSYHLNLNGFAFDPRIFTFTLSGDFSQQVQDPGETMNSHGYGFIASILNEKPQSGILFWAPQPIQLRYSHFSTEGTDNDNYGISLTYWIPRNLVFFSREGIVSLAPTYPGNIPNYSNGNGGNGGSQPFTMTFPTLNFDYDKYKFDTDSTHNETDNYDLRANTSTAHARYYLDYNVINGKGQLDTQSKAFSAEADYNYLLSPGSVFQSINQYRNIQSDSLSQTTASDRSTYYKSLGVDYKDLLNSRFFALYSNSNDFESYSLQFLNGYNKYLSANSHDYIEVSVSYGKNESDTTHSETLLNIYEISPSQSLTLRNSIAVGQNENGEQYSFGVGATHSARISTNAGYDFISSPTSSEGRSTGHFFHLGFIGALWRDIRFGLDNRYSISQVDEPPDAFTERTVYSRADLYWNIDRVYFNLGGNFTESSRNDTINTYSNIKGLYLVASAPLARRMFLSVPAIWTRDNTGREDLNISPYLTWFYRKISLAAEYNYHQVKQDSNERTDQRIYIRLTRYFNGYLF